MIGNTRLSKSTPIVVAGGGGFIGGHLVADLLRQGYTSIRSVDIKPLDEWYQVHRGVKNIAGEEKGDLKNLDNCRRALKGCKGGYVFQLAADMGGMGFIENNKALCMLSVLTNTHMILAAKDEGIDRFFYSSSACVYNADKQTNADVTALKEADAYPAMPEDGYGWEKLFSERMCRHFREDYGLKARVARFHNVYGPFGTWEGGREKAPAAICRKVIAAKQSGKHQIEIWGDGEQTRSFMYISDCLRGIQTLTNSDFIEPINLGSSELVSINQLVSIAENIAGIRLDRSYKLDAPKGVRGRNSDNTLIRKVFAWEPDTRLRDGMQKTYEWIEQEWLAKYGSGKTVSAPKPARSKTASKGKPKPSTNGKHKKPASKGRAKVKAR
ncbi:MAG: NAD-dependent epimerase/dehydratase family protein [Phycisphaerales bacterium]|nr:NAD-dependent epimerase/dehydratase family protein [Phycisphaerales bacterium]